MGAIALRTEARRKSEQALASGCTVGQRMRQGPVRTPEAIGGRCFAGGGARALLLNKPASLVGAKAESARVARQDRGRLPVHAVLHDADA